MKLSTKGRYALRFMLFLSIRGGSPVSIKDVSEKTGISGKYLEQIVPSLSRAGLVKAIRGSQGGYTLSGDPSTVTVYDIIAAAGDVRDHIEEDPLTDYIWDGLERAQSDYLSGITLKDIAERNTDDGFYCI